MDRLKVKSKGIESIGYDFKNKYLEVEFRGGSIYGYSLVFSNQYNNLMSSGSHKEFLEKFIQTECDFYSKMN